MPGMFNLAWAGLAIEIHCQLSVVRCHNHFYFMTMILSDRFQVLESLKQGLGNSELGLGTATRNTGSLAPPTLSL